MSWAKYRLTRTAERDIDSILAETTRLFGSVQRRNYTALLKQAARMISDAPRRPGSRDRSDLRDGLRSFHLELAARRRGAASHVLFYLTDMDEVTIVRVLHHAMEPSFHLVDDKL